MLLSARPRSGVGHTPAVLSVNAQRILHIAQAEMSCPLINTPIVAEQIYIRGLAHCFNMLIYWTFFHEPARRTHNFHKRPAIAHALCPALPALSGRACLLD